MKGGGELKEVEICCVPCAMCRCARVTLSCLGCDFVTAGQCLGGTAAVAVDANSDGCLDVPATGFTNPLASTIGNRSLYIRALGRNNLQNQHGVVVCVRRTGTSQVVGCRVVDGGGVNGVGQVHLFHWQRRDVAGRRAAVARCR